MTVRTKIVGALVAIILVITAPSFYAIFKLDELRGLLLHRQSEFAAAYLSLTRLEMSLQILYGSHGDYTSTPNEQLSLEMRRAVSNARFGLSQLSDMGYDEVAAPIRARVDTLEMISARLEQLVGDGLTESARAYFDSIQPAYLRTETLVQSMGAAIDRNRRLDALREVEVSLSARASILAVWASVAFASTLGLAALWRLLATRLGASTSIREAIEQLEAHSRQE
jgi:hypothetical protein